MTLLAAVTTLALGVGVAAPQQPELQSTAKQKTWAVRGRVVDEERRGIEGACVLLAPDESWTTARVLAEPTTKSGADGRFEVAWPEPPADAFWRDLPVLSIAAEGRMCAIVQPYYLAWRARLFGDGSNRIEIGDVPLPRGVTLEGRVRKERGRPLAGARVVARDALQNLTALGSFDSTGVSYMSVGRSDEKGAFTLQGVCPGGVAVRITADGYHARELPFVTERDPLDVELEPGGFVDGVVTDPGGRPVAAQVAVEYEVSGEVRPTATGADGRFRLNLDYPHRYRLTGYPLSKGMSFGEIDVATSEVLDGPATGVQLRKPADPDPKVAVTVRAVDAATKQPIEDFEAAALWVDPGMLALPQDYLDRMFSSSTHRANAGAAVRLPGPREGEPGTGLLRVKAKGYATVLEKDLEWQEDSPPELELALRSESVLSGTVVDADSGEPVVGAYVVNGRRQAGMPPPWAYDTLGTAAGRTDDKGRFRLDGLGKGVHRLRAMHPVRPQSAVSSVQLGAGERKVDVRIEIPAGATLSGKIAGGEPGPGSVVKLTESGDSQQDFTRGMPGGYLGPHSTILGADGSFAIPHLAREQYDLALLLPRDDGRAGFLELPIESVRVGASDLENDIDLAQHRPGQIRGRISVRGTPIPPERLVVIAETDEPNRRRMVIPGQTRGEMRAAAADGRFDVPVAPGSYRLRVVDRATAIVLLEQEEPIRIESGAAAQLDVELELVLVRVTLKPAEDGGAVAAARLEVDVEHGSPNGPDTAFAGIPISMNTSPGVPLADGRRQVELLLPAVPTTLRVHSNIDALTRAAGAWQPPKPLVEREFTPEPGGINRLEIVVPPPRKVETGGGKR